MLKDKITTNSYTQQCVPTKIAIKRLFKVGTNWILLFFRTANSWKWIYLSMVHPRDLQHPSPLQVHRHRRPPMLKPIPSLPIAAAKAIAAEK